MNVMLIFGFVLSLGVLTLFAAKIPQEEETESLASNDDPSSYRGASSVKRGLTSGLCNCMRNISIGGYS